MSRTLHLVSVIFVAVGGALFIGPSDAVSADKTPGKLPNIYNKVVSLYLNDKWDELQGVLNCNANSWGDLQATQKADVAYIRETLGECHPSWWKLAKEHKKFVFHPVIWGRKLDASFDPDVKPGMQLKYSGNQVSLTLCWPTADMDNPAHAEHGFSKGELNNLGVWIMLGQGKSWVEIPLETLRTLPEREKTRMQRYLDFRGNVSGVYYARPRARRGGLFLYLLAYQEPYAKTPTAMARQAIGAMFTAEVMAHPDKYPSLPLPKTLPAEGAEAQIALYLKAWIEKHDWTLAEDKLLRDAIRSLAITNDKTVFVSGQVQLANNTRVNLDPSQDQSNRQKRDAWVKSQFDKVTVIAEPFE